MGKEIIGDRDETEQETAMKRAGVNVKKILKKCVYLLPSGRKMTVILDDGAVSVPAMPCCPE